MAKHQFIILSLLLTLTISFQSPAQSDTTDVEEIGNSCQPFFDDNKISIHYSYTVAIQTHNYSGNWDFDGDGNTDELYFIGTGGAHLYFYLRIVLSSDKKVRNFPFLELDLPCLGRITELKNAKFYPPPLLPQFVVDKFYTNGLGNNTNDKIYLHLDDSHTIPTEWRKKGVTTRYLLLWYDKGEMTIKNFIE
jgi:hypothetical protein